MAAKNPIAYLVLVAGIALAPFLLPPTIATEILIFAIVAVAANLLIGLSGLFSFGQAAFFGLGGYTGGWLLANFDLPLVVPLLAGALVGGGAAAAIGAICIRRAGMYFIMLTFAFNQMIYYVAYSWRDVTGGEDGLAGIVRPDIGLFGASSIDLNGPLAFYVLVSALFLISFAMMSRIAGSPLGRIMVATRDNTRRAASIGYNVSNAQTLVFALSGAFTGLAGVLYSMLYWIMPIDAVHWLNSGYIVFMVLIGGTSSLFGPVMGAAIFIWLQDFFSTIWARWPLLFGLVVVAVVMFLQGGITELFERVARSVRTRRLATPAGQPDAAAQAGRSGAAMVRHPMPRHQTPRP
jgi:branched-chain amino acid transport system permease protein